MLETRLTTGNAVVRRLELGPTTTTVYIDGIGAKVVYTELDEDVSMM